MTPAVPSAPRPLLLRFLGGFLGALLHWTPVFLALAFFAQLALLGLRPALAERARLAAVGERLEERLDAQSDQNAELAAFRAALDDPVYRERLRLHQLAAAAVAPE